MQLTSALEAALGCTLPATLAFDYPTVDALVDFLASDPSIFPLPQAGAAGAPATVPPLAGSTVALTQLPAAVLEAAAGTAVGIAASSLRLPGRNAASSSSSTSDRFDVPPVTVHWAYACCAG